MPESANVESLDAVVVGANLRGLVTAWVLGELGLRAVVVERAPRVGGADSSFVTPGGAVFDHGLHVLDAARSALATRLFTHVVDAAVHEVVLRRAIVLRNAVVPYAPALRDLPPPLQKMLPGPDLVDAIGGALPTRDRLSQSYGRAFTDLIFDEVLPSFPSEARHLAFGVDESRLLTNIYPWFFPKAARVAVTSDESRAFHDRLRNGIEQRVLYPAQGGFGGFAEGFLRHLARSRIEVLTGATDLHVEVRPGTHVVEWVRAGGRHLSAPHYFWASAWPALCDLLGLPCQNVITDLVLLGSFCLNRPAQSPYHEILVGDPEHHVNRVYFPAMFRATGDPLMQVEFAVPRAGSWPTEADHWRDTWFASARRLGLLAEDHRVVEFNFRQFPMHFNGFGAEGEALRDADPALLDPGSNVRPVVPSMANLNVNRYVPRVVKYVAAVMGSPDFACSWELDTLPQ